MNNINQYKYDKVTKPYLTDSSRKSARGKYRYAYTENQMDRKVEDEHLLPLSDEIVNAKQHIFNSLIDNQLEEIVNNLPIHKTKKEIVKFLLLGLTSVEIAKILNLTERCISYHIHGLRRYFSSNMWEQSMPSHYGWQTIFIQSQYLKGIDNA